MHEPTWSVPSAQRREIIEHLTGIHPDGQHPPAITARGQGGKFLSDGTVLPFPGNTFICHLDRKSAFYAALCDMQDGLKAMPHADHFTFLPQPSFHMTIFCGISGSPLGSDGWPNDLSRDATLETITATFRDSLAQEQGPDGFSVIATGLMLPTTIEMGPASPQDAEKLLNMRRKLQDLTGIYRPDFKSYQFHVGMAYLTQWLSPDNAEQVMITAEQLFEQFLGKIGQIELGLVEFCTFETMHHFEPLGTLGNKGFTPVSKR
tara:strand:- start:19295 stop:20080 length:786 start_codon:yes stop_codon:yes gene_type:complete